MAHPRRLIEVDLPIARISAESRREKSIRHGHISTLHIWWARRPLAACRAVTLAALWPDPADPTCPEAFRDGAAKEMRAWRDERGGPARDWSDPLAIRGALLDFIADFSSWNNSSAGPYLDLSRRLVRLAHNSLGGAPDTRPMLVDSFAGGGAIPLEGLRVGADAFASDLNPVAVLLEKFVLEMVPRHGEDLGQCFAKAAADIQRRAESELRPFYPDDEDGSRPVAYLWARTAISDAPSMGQPPVEVPMLTTMWLSNRRNDFVALRWVRDDHGRVVTDATTVVLANGKAVDVRRPRLEVFRPSRRDEVEPPPVARGAATCPVTGYTTSAEAVRLQFKDRRGGAEDARLVAVVTSRPGQQGKHYRLPNEGDLNAVATARAVLTERSQNPTSFGAVVPDEELPYLRSIFNIQLLGVHRWGDLFTARQTLAISTYVRLVRDAAAALDGTPELQKAVHTALAFAVDRVADKCASLVVWNVPGGKVEHVFGRQALGIVWDFADANPLADIGWAGACEWIQKVIQENTRANLTRGQAEMASATSHPLPDDSADLFFTDPPYYDAVPYADLSDFFYVWLKRSLGDRFPDLLSADLTPKRGEIVQLAERNQSYAYKTREYFIDLMAQAMSEGRRVLKPGGIGVIVFAHKTTVGWESQLQAMIDAGWTVTGSWPIDTEMATRLRAQNSAVLASSVHLVCRPRESHDGKLDDHSVGDWRDVLSALPSRIHEWMPRLAAEGVVGADAIFACLGPALEVYTRYSRVERANGEIVTLREFLEHVWASVAREALSLVFVDADATGLEEDARLTAMWLWTLYSPESDAEDAEPDASEDAGVGGRSGYVLEFDAARKIAQGLGANIEAMPNVVQVKGDVARLLGIRERARYLEDSQLEPEARVQARRGQMSLFAEPAPHDLQGRPDAGPMRVGVSTLDRLHQAMILFGSGRSDALQRFLAEGPGSEARFWSLAQSLSALYPRGSDEKRWVDGVLARKKSFGY